MKRILILTAVVIGVTMGARPMDLMAQSFGADPGTQSTSTIT